MQNNKVEPVIAVKDAFSHGVTSHNNLTILSHNILTIAQ